MTTLWTGFSSGRPESQPILNSPEGMSTNSIPMLLRRVSNDAVGTGIWVAGGYIPTATWGPNGCCPAGAGDGGVVPSLGAAPELDDSGTAWGGSRGCDAAVLPGPVK